MQTCPFIQVLLVTLNKQQSNGYNRDITIFVNTCYTVACLLVRYVCIYLSLMLRLDHEPINIYIYL